MDPFETSHLSLNDLGNVWLERLYDADGACLLRRVCLGDVEDEIKWPKRLGAEPRWLLTEVEELADSWAEHLRDSRLELGMREHEKGPIR